MPENTCPFPLTSTQRVRILLIDEIGEPADVFVPFARIKMVIEFALAVVPGGVKE